MTSSRDFHHLNLDTISLNELLNSIISALKSRPIISGISICRPSSKISLTVDKHHTATHHPQLNKLSHLRIVLDTHHTVIHGKTTFSHSIDVAPANELIENQVNN